MWPSKFVYFPPSLRHVYFLCTVLLFVIVVWQIFRWDLFTVLNLEFFYEYHLDSQKGPPSCLRFEFCWNMSFVCFEFFSSLADQELKRSSSSLNLNSNYLSKILKTWNDKWSWDMQWIVHEKKCNFIAWSNVGG